MCSDMEMFANVRGMPARTFEECPSHVSTLCMFRHGNVFTRSKKPTILMECLVMKCNSQIVGHL